MNGRDKTAVTVQLVGYIVASIILVFATYNYVMAQVDEKIITKYEQLESMMIESKKAAEKSERQLTRSIQASETRINDQIKTLIEVLSVKRPTHPDE